MFRTACFVAALTLCAATAPPRISLELSSVTHTTFNDTLVSHDLVSANMHGFDLNSHSDYAQECEGHKDTVPSATCSCMFPIGKAYDNAGGDLSDKIDVIIVLLDNDQLAVNTTVYSGKNEEGVIPTSACNLTNTITGQSAGATRSTYVFYYGVMDDSGNEAEQVTFALVINDVQAPEISMDQGSVIGSVSGTYSGTGSSPTQTLSQVQKEYGTGFFLDKIDDITADDNVDHTIEPVVSVTGLPDVNGATPCKANMADANEKVQCSGYDSNHLPWNSCTLGTSHLSNVQVDVADHAGVYGYNGANNVFTLDYDILFQDTTPPVWKEVESVGYGRNETHECDRTDATMIEEFNATQCYDDANDVAWKNINLVYRFGTTTQNHTNSSQAHVPMVQNNVNWCKRNKISTENGQGICMKTWDCKDHQGLYPSDSKNLSRYFEVTDTTPPTVNVTYTDTTGSTCTGSACGGGESNPLSRTHRFLDSTNHPDTYVHYITPNADNHDAIMEACCSSNNTHFNTTHGNYQCDHSDGSSTKPTNAGCAAAMLATRDNLTWHCTAHDQCNIDESFSVGNAVNTNTASFGDDIHDLLQIEDTCTTSFNYADVTATWENGVTFDPRKVGVYVRNYTITDASGNLVHAHISITLQDPDAPLIQVLNCDANSDVYDNCLKRLNAEAGTRYDDDGASCHDFVDGMLSHAVEVSGSVVDMQVPDTYIIRYDCQDLSGNAATPGLRTVYVEDNSVPVITINGNQENFVEAGFPFEDPGACYTDELDGVCCTSKDDPRQNATHFTAPNTRQCVSATPTCDDNSSDGTDQCENNRADCSCRTVEKEVTSTCSTTQCNKFAEGLRLALTEMPYAGHPVVENSTVSFKAAAAAAGALATYEITYHARDFHGVQDAVNVTRTIYVKDTLPPVITLHVAHNATHDNVYYKQGLTQSTTTTHTNASFATYTNGVNNPAADVAQTHLFDEHPSSFKQTNHYNMAFNNANFPSTNGGFMPSLMAETTSVNGWLLAAVASAVAGVALLSFSAKSSSQVMVPV